jgi:hypothetical protein
MSDMSEEAMMGGGEGMNDPSMQASMEMEESMVDESGEQFADAGFGDTSLAHAEGGGEPGSESALAGDSSTNPGTDDAIMEAQMAAAETAANSAGEPGSDPATTSAEMAAAATANGEFGPGSEGGEFGENPGGPGSNGDGGGKAQEPPADSPDYPAFKIVMGLMEGKHDGLKDHVATRGRGLIEKIRGGSLTSAEKDDLKKTFAQPQLVGTPRTIRGSRTVTLNSAGQVITLVSKKQGTEWKVSSISIKAATNR